MISIVYDCVKKSNCDGLTVVFLIVVMKEKEKSKYRVKNNCQTVKIKTTVTTLNFLLKEYILKS